MNEAASRIRRAGRRLPTVGCVRELRVILGLRLNRGKAFLDPSVQAAEVRNLGGVTVKEEPQS
jgi:hypothetical protein